jgi:ectoine hydroxylase-related dioxygenase (phytanoyl-CoA dioxygenase family)
MELLFIDRKNTGSLSQSEVDQFNEVGALVIRNGMGNRLNNIRKAISILIKRISSNNPTMKIFSDEQFDAGLAVLLKEDRKKVSKIYDVVRCITEVRGVAGDDYILKIVKQLMGTDVLYLNHNWMLSMKVPGEKFHDFPWHQDLPYTFASPNGITIWQGLKSISETFDGSLEIILGSHKAGCLPFRVAETANKQIHYVPILDETTKKLPRIKLRIKAGDLLVFNTSLVHRSIANNLDKTLWNFHYRFSDALHEEPVKRGWHPINPYIFSDKDKIKYMPKYIQNKAVLN